MIIAAILVSVGVNVGLRSETIEAEVCSQCPLLCQHIVSYFCKSVQSVQVCSQCPLLCQHIVSYFCKSRQCVYHGICTLCALFVCNINGLENATDCTDLFWKGLKMGAQHFLCSEQCLLQLSVLNHCFKIRRRNKRCSKGRAFCQKPICWSKIWETTKKERERHKAKQWVRASRASEEKVEGTRGQSTTREAPMGSVKRERWQYIRDYLDRIHIIHQRASR